MYEKVFQTILDTKIVAILRGVKVEQVKPVAMALYRGGIRCIEVTFDQAKGPEKTVKSMELLAEAFDGKMFIGAGTVLTVEQVEAAHRAGGTFIISPGIDQQVIRRTRELGLVSIPGAATATEVIQADQWGASIVKIFPAGDLGPSYIKSLRGPLEHIIYCAVGGVDHKNLAAFHRAGVSCFGVGSNIARKDLLAAEDYAGIEANARLYTMQTEVW